MKQYIQGDGEKPIPSLEIGDKIVTKSRVVTKTDVELFAITTGDTGAMFLSEEMAKSRGWKTQLVPGLLSFSLAVGLLHQGGFIPAIAFMGTDKVRFLAPVYPGDAIRVEAELLSKRETKKETLVCSYKWIIRNQNDEAVVEGENTCMFPPCEM